MSMIENTLPAFSDESIPEGSVYIKGIYPNRTALVSTLSKKVSLDEIFKAKTIEMPDSIKVTELGKRLEDESNYENFVILSTKDHAKVGLDIDIDTVIVTVV